MGSGGFEIRGLSPVTDAAGKQLGSVEVLHDFSPVLEGVSRGQGQEAPRGQVSSRRPFHAFPDLHGILPVLFRL